jgi:hypothetical protein
VLPPALAVIAVIAILAAAHVASSVLMAGMGMAA